MLQVKNSTPFKALLVMLADRHGIDTLFTVIKGTFTLAERTSLASEQLPIIGVDQYYGDQSTTSVRIPSDISLEKIGTDVVVNGCAVAPHGVPTWEMDVSVSVGPVAKSIRVFGDRVWDTGAAGPSISWIKPFVRMPIIWERAFGGADETDAGRSVDSRNPVGVGFRARGGRKSTAGVPLPNVEDPTALISSTRDAPNPAGLATVAPHWLPRRSFAGTYDATWQQSRAPFLPRDFDPRFCQIAPLGMTTPSYLQGGERVELRGLTAEAMRLSVPAARVEAHYSLNGATEVRPANLDTIVLEPDQRRLIAVWRAVLPCDKKVLKIREVETIVAALDGVA